MDFPHVDVHFTDALFHNCIITTRLKYVASNSTRILITARKMKRMLLQIFNREHSETCFGSCIWRLTPLTRGLYKYNCTSTSKSLHHQRHWFLKAPDHMRGFSETSDERTSVWGIHLKDRDSPKGKREGCLLLPQFVLWGRHWWKLLACLHLQPPLSMQHYAPPRRTAAQVSGSRLASRRNVDMCHTDDYLEYFSFLYVFIDMPRIQTFIASKSPDH